MSPTSETRPLPDQRRRRAGRDAPADAAPLRAARADHAEPDRAEHPPLLAGRRREPAADPGALRGGPQPGRNRARDVARAELERAVRRAEALEAELREVVAARREAEAAAVRFAPARSSSPGAAPRRSPARPARLPPRELTEANTTKRENPKMPVDKPTVRAQEAIAAAARTRAERGNPVVEPDHLLAALLDAREGVVEPGAGAGRRRHAALRAATVTPRWRAPAGERVGHRRAAVSPAFRCVTAPRRRGGRAARRRVHLDRAPAAGPRSRSRPGARRAAAARA